MIASWVAGRTSEGPVVVYRMSLACGMSATVMNLGGTVMKLEVPGADGLLTDVICGYDGYESYLRASGYQGALIGRYANRIGGASFELEGKTYPLAPNDGKNTLHGGAVGFDRHLFEVEAEDGEEPALHLHRVSPHMEEGFPGNLDLRVTYRLGKDLSLSISYQAKTDRDTYLNLTNHMYFNLGGYASGSVLEHRLCLDADRYLPVDGELIPTGQIAPVGGTPFDFRVEKALGLDIGQVPGGYDHCFVFTERAGERMPLRAELKEPGSGRRMLMYTDQPCVQVYSGNMMRDPVPFKGGTPQTPRHAICLETQHMPDSMHHPGFTDCLLRAGQTFTTETKYQFSARKD
ncbi:MAG: galactose mutarotase [Clostridia bacterium]|nr:galactose mutarotase [Clostridia bacterium]